jgi:hypothetical protein
MQQHSTVIPRRLSKPEAAAVRHLLRRSALSDCPGTLGRVVLDDQDDLVLRSFDTWSFSSGEEVLLDVVRFIVGEPVRWPELSKVDDFNAQIVRESMRLLTGGRLLSEVPS